MGRPSADSPGYSRTSSWLRTPKEDGTRTQGKARRTGETEKDVKTTATSAKERDSGRQRKMGRRRGSCKACYPRARVCVHEQHEIVFAESQASSPLRDKPGLSRSSRTESHEKISRQRSSTPSPVKSAS